MDTRIRRILLLVVILGAGLRIWGLDFQSLWGDELGSWRMSHENSISAVINNAAANDCHPPAYHILLYYIEKWGDSAVFLRSPSVISGILSIVMIFLLGCRLYSWREGLLASMLMAFLKCPLYYSQEARPYAMLLLFSMITYYYWLSIVEHLWNKEKIPVFVLFGYLITSITSCYLHYFGLYFIALQSIVAVLFFCRTGKSLISWAFIYFAILLAYVPWISVAYDQSRHSLGPQPTGGIIETFNGFLKFLFNDSQAFVVLVVALFSYSLARLILKKRKFQLRKDLLLIGWLIVPLIGDYMVCKYTSLHFFKYRTLIISLPAAYLLFARAVVRLPFNLRSKIIGVLVLTAALIFQLFFVIKYYSKPTKEQYREAVGFMAQNDSTYKDSMIIGSVVSVKWIEYYFQKKNSNRRVKYNLINKAQRAEVFRLFERDHIPEHVWYIYFDYLNDKSHNLDDQFLNLLKIKMLLVENRKYLGGGVYLFANKEEYSPGNP